MLNLMIAGMLALTAQDVPLDAPDGMKRCMLTETVRLGSSNTENSETIVRAAWTSCRPYVAHFDLQSRGEAQSQIYEVRRGERGYAQTFEEVSEERKERVTGEAILALLDARASRDSP